MKPLVYKKSRRKKRQQTVVRERMWITEGDKVQVMSGDFKGREGTVLRVLPKTGGVVIEGVNIVKKHKAATQNTEGGIIEFPSPIHHSNVMLLDPKSGGPTRVRRRKNKDGTIERLSVKSGQPIPRNG